MKICYINPTFLVRRPIAELIRLLSNDNEVAIFVPKKPFKQPEKRWHSDEALKKAKIYSYSAINIPFINFEWPIPITPVFFINLFRIFFRYNIIHMWTYFYINSFFTLFYKLFRKKTKLIMTCDTFPGYSFYPGFLTNILFKIYTRIFGWFIFSVPNKIHVYGKSMIKHAKKAGVEEKKIGIVPTGINIEKFKNAKLTNRRELGIRKNDFVVFYAGLIVPRKGIDIMLDTIKKLARKQKNVKLLLVGEGPAKQKYKKMAKSLGIKMNVIFTGWRKDVPNVLKSADVLFLPSRGEGLAGIIMEAMSSGLPVISSNIPCTTDLIEDGKTGFLCEMEDIKCYAEKLEQLIKNKKLKEQFGKEGLRKIRNFSWNKIVIKYKNLYRGNK
ncbi:glycosyltransferase family 4 protein [Candidatus Woesearchaeota archaeon]|nr:glycosyltransferase family 4 protein [Candidatus Woesearchaeota archaeon]